MNSTELMTLEEREQRVAVLMALHKKIGLEVRPEDILFDYTKNLLPLSELIDLARKLGLEPAA